MKKRIISLVLVLCMVVFSLFIAGCSTDRDTTVQRTATAQPLRAKRVNRLF